MNICLVSAYFYPRSKGGTEKYVLELARKLISEDNNVEIITVHPAKTINYWYENIFVRAILESGYHGKAVVSGQIASNTLNKFSQIILEQKYDIIHFHTLTPAFGIHHLKKAKKLGFMVHFTAHIPAISCLHGDLMLYGNKACDGKINERCMSCYISKKRIPKGLSILIGKVIQTLNYPKSIAQVVNKKSKELMDLSIFCDKIFIFTNWQWQIYIENGIPPAKLIVLQQMPIKAPGSGNAKEYTKEATNNITIGFAGRICYEKGLHNLINCFKKLPKQGLQLIIAGILDETSSSYFNELKNSTKSEKNIIWSFNLDDSQLQNFYHEIDYLCIPSIWYETGPYVLYEAFNNDTPVIANNLGDMQVWKDKGYPIKLYNNQYELLQLLEDLLLIKNNNKW